MNILRLHSTYLRIQNFVSKLEVIKVNRILIKIRIDLKWDTKFVSR